MTITPLWQHQKDAIEKAGNRFALFFDPGCGKTRTAIELLKKFNEYKTTHNQQVPAPSIKKILIFAPLNVCRNWENEIAEYLGAPYKTFLVSGQSKSKKLKILQSFQDCFENKHLFLICNIESVRSKEYMALLSKCGATFVIIDESHNFKTPASVQTKNLFAIENTLRPKYLYLLTGTPAPQGDIDLWSTFTLLGKNRDSFFIWRKKHFDDKNERRRGKRGYWPEYTVSKNSRIYFKALLNECSSVARKDEVLDLPPLLRTNIFAEMSPEQSRHYDTMKEFLFAIDDTGNELNASNLLSRSLRLQQILAGLIGDCPIKDNPRLAAVEDAIEKTNGMTVGQLEPQQFIIWTIFKPTYKQLENILCKLGISHGFLTGEQTAEERFQYMEDFQAGKIRALIAHPKAGGVGVNLTAASYSINYTRSYNLVDHLQAEARNYRGGSEKHGRITSIDIITPNTIDEEIVKALREKKSVQEFILGLKEHNDKRHAA